MTDNKLDNFGKVVLYLIKGSPGFVKLKLEKDYF